MRDITSVKAALLNAVAGADFTSAEATEILKSFTQEMMLRTRVSDLPASPVLTAAAPDILLRDAEQDIQFAIAEGGLSPAHERMIDAMQKILAYLALQKEK